MFSAKRVVSFGFVVIFFLSAIFPSLGFCRDCNENCYTSSFCRGTKCLRDGFYIGLGVGYDAYKIRESDIFTSVVTPTIPYNPSLSAKGWMGNIFGGYGLYFDRFYFGGEIFANKTDAQVEYGTTSTAGNNVLNFFVYSGFGASILPGIKLNNSSLFFVRLGYVRTFFKSHENGVSNSGLFSEAVTKWLNGINVGLGIETDVYECLSLRTEFSYTTYNAFLSPFNTRFAPSNNQVDAGLIYHFA